MNRQPYEKPPRWWSPKISRRWVAIWRPLRTWQRVKRHRLLEVEVRGSETVRQLLQDGCGVLITPNHCSHADGVALYEAADQVGCPFYAMMAWQVFARGGWVQEMVLRHHGAFSVDREGTDMAAVRQATEILRSEPYPLTIFPEGEVYHLNERLTPFREGAAALAIMAARKATRPVVCVPCGIRYTYVQDPTPDLLKLMNRLEEALFWRPRPDLGLPERIYRLAEGMLALKEIELLGHTSSGPLPDRIRAFIEFLLQRVEQQYELRADGQSVPERVKAGRRAIIARLEKLPDDDPQREPLEAALDDLFLAVQAYSYPGNYVSENPTTERIAETLDKFEEDLLEVPTANIRGARRATVTFGNPILVESSREKKQSPQQLTRLLQDEVAELLKTPS